MKLHDLMDEAVAHVTADSETLLAQSRREARMHRAAVAIGVAASVAVVGGGLWALSAGPGDDTARDWASIDIAQPAPDEPLAASTGRSTAAALIAAVDVVHPGGTFSNITGTDRIGPTDQETYAQMTLRTSAGSEQIEVNIQPVPDAARLKSLQTCDFPTVSCVRINLSGGDFVLTYEQTGNEPSWSASMVSPRRHLRVVIGEWGTLLTSAELAALTEEPWWGFRLPRSLAAAGDAMPYHAGPAQSAAATPRVPLASGSAHASTPASPDTGSPAAPPCTSGQLTLRGPSMTVKGMNSIGQQFTLTNKSAAYCSLAPRITHIVGTEADGTRQPIAHLEQDGLEVPYPVKVGALAPGESAGFYFMEANPSACAPPTPVTTTYTTVAFSVGPEARFTMDTSADPIIIGCGDAGVSGIGTTRAQATRGGTR